VPKREAMRKTVLVTTGNGMFGGALISALAGEQDIEVRAMVRPGRQFEPPAPNVVAVHGDMDDPSSLVELMSDVTHVFLVTPMTDEIAVREGNVVDAAVAGGSNPHIIKIYGAVQHHGDHLDSLHQTSLAHIRDSGLPWSLVSPNSVMETCFLWLPETLKLDAIFGTSGHGKVGFVALSDVGAVAAAVIRDDRPSGENLRLTGPAALDMYEVADRFSEGFGRPITYYDMPEDDFASMLLSQGAFPDREAVEMNVLCHFRAWRRGGAELVTTTVDEVTGRPPVSVAEWISRNKEKVDLPRTDADRAAAAQVSASFATR